MRLFVVAVPIAAGCIGGSGGPQDTGKVSTDAIVDADGDGFAVGGGDCDDADPAVYPTATDDVGDGVDQNCDGVDGVDGDGDGFASEASGGLDCNDNNSAIAPSVADPVGDGVDTNCDGVDGVDGDGDGHPSEASGGLDCDDANPDIHPDAEEICGSGVDEDCDGASLDAIDWHLDADGDGYGDPGALTAACAAPPDHVADAGDCDDGNPSAYPGAPELCDGVDNDCNHTVDDALGPDCVCSLAAAPGCDAHVDCVTTHGHSFEGDPLPAACPLATQLWPSATTDDSCGASCAYSVSIEGLIVEVALTEHDLVWDGGGWEMSGIAEVVLNDAGSPAQYVIDVSFFGIPQRIVCDVSFDVTTVSFEGGITLSPDAGSAALAEWRWDAEPTPIYEECDLAILELYGFDPDPPILAELDDALAAWALDLEAQMDADLAAAVPFSEVAACVPATCGKNLTWAADPTSGECTAFDTNCPPYGWAACGPPDLTGAVGVCEP